MVKYSLFGREHKQIFQECEIHFDDYFNLCAFYDVYNDTIEEYGFISLFEVLVLLDMANTDFEDLKDFSEDELCYSIILTKKIKSRDVKIKTCKHLGYVPHAEWIVKIPKYEIIKD